MLKFTAPDGTITHEYPLRVRTPDGYTLTGPEVSPSLLNALGWTVEVIDDPVEIDSNVAPAGSTTGTEP